MLCERAKKSECVLRKIDFRRKLEHPNPLSWALLFHSMVHSHFLVFFSIIYSVEIYITLFLACNMSAWLHNGRLIYKGATIQQLWSDHNCAVSCLSLHFAYREVLYRHLYCLWWQATGLFSVFPSMYSHTYYSITNKCCTDMAVHRHVISASVGMKLRVHNQHTSVLLMLWRAASVNNPVSRSVCLYQPIIQTLQLVTLERNLHFY